MSDLLIKQEELVGDVDWRTQGIRVVRTDERSGDTPETLGMNRQVAISGSRTQSNSLWAGTNLIRPDSQTGPHHHGPLESVIYIVRGNAHMRWGDRLEWITKAGPGDFLLVPAWLPHQEINPSSSEDLHCVLVRSGVEEVVVNLELDAVDSPEWIERPGLASGPLG
jgi:uncharacterized RmlC-like cupin family protein